MMLSSIVATILAASTAVSAAACRRSQSSSITPHDSYSSSIGALGCKLNTNHVVYWPFAPDCNNICIKVTHGENFLYVIHVDQSGGAYDMSYEAWNHLVSGQSATVDPQMGGGVDMQWEFVDNENCVPLFQDGKIALSASNSMNYVSSCLSQPNSWVAQNYQLYNILDSQCKWGYDEVCTLNLAQSNQASCPHQLGMPVATKGLNVTNVQYGTGKLVAA